MASYTMELRNYIEGFTEDDIPTRERIEEGRKKLFDFNYPIFDPSYKAVFETNFIRNFYMREIGFETEGLFKFQLETWLLINMPYFNKMFESELIDFDPLMNSRMDSTATRNRDTDGTVDVTSNGKVDGTVNGDNFTRLLENDTPDSRLAITTQDGSGVIEYASKIRESDTKDNVTTSTNNDTTGNTQSVVTETEDYIQSRIGKTGSDSYSKMMMEYRQSLVRIEKKMFDEMQQLFMLVY